MKKIEAAKVEATRVAIIGAGIAGLSAAIYAQRSGFDVTLIEQHSIPGGMCTSWKRKGYLFEGGIHWMTGSSPKTELYQLWKETGALNDNVPVLLHDPFRSVECDGQIIHLYRDIDKTAEHLLTISPKDERRIRKLVKNVKALCTMQMPIFDVKGAKTMNPKRITPGFFFKMLPALPVVIRLGKLSCKDYAGQFEHPGLQRLFSFMPEYDASSLMFTLATLHAGDGGYPEGGSLAMTERMAKMFTDLGGRLLLKTKALKVNIENGAAKGVTLENGTLDADAVIVTQETIAALDKLFDPPPKDAWLDDLRKTTKPSVCTFVCVGIHAEIPGFSLPEWILAEPIRYAEKTVTEIFFNNYAGYEGYAPEGCSALTTVFTGDTYDFWKQAKEEGRYEQEKQALADQICWALCQKYPQLEGNIEVVDIATPLTYEQYTGAYHGSWMALTEVGDKRRQYSGFSESVSGLYFAGHRLMPPGGLPVALVTGRNAAQMICRQFGVIFK